MTFGVNSRYSLIFSFLILSAITPVSGASSSDGHGSISGRVLDTGGGVIQQVTVTLRNQETGIEQSVSTDPAGAFRFEDLPAALYYLSSEKEYFQNAVQEILLSHSQNTTVDLTLQIDSQASIR